MAIKIKFRDPINQDKILTFTTDKYEYNGEKEIYYFTDKYGVKWEWRKDLYIGTESTNRTEGDYNEE